MCISIDCFHVYTHRGIRLDDVIKAECEDLRTENEALNLLYVVEKEKHEYNVESVKFKFKDNGSAERWKSCIDTAIDNLGESINRRGSKILLPPT